MLSRQALAMKNKGYKTFLITMDQINSNDYLLIKDGFVMRPKRLFFQH